MFSITYVGSSMNKTIHKLSNIKVIKKKHRHSVQNEISYEKLLSNHVFQS